VRRPPVNDSLVKTLETRHGGGGVVSEEGCLLRSCANWGNSLSVEQRLKRPQHGLQILLPSTLHVSAEAQDENDHDDGTIRKQAK
jgi:hypothetical protein